MSMTAESKQYFQANAGQWDTLRAGYFSEAVRDSAIRKAYLRPEMVVADVGGGTGFITAGLAPLVRKVFLVDGSPEMLVIARQNLKGFQNVTFQEADGLSIPLPDASLDAVFANMYLHHIPDPLPAIKEMVRVLRPGGRLVVTDVDAHPYEWMRVEMADVWLGFERYQVREWFEQAGLVNVILDCTGESCCAKSKDAETGANEEHQAQISVFVAVGTRRVPGVREAVMADYSKAAEGGSGCCSTQSSQTSNAEGDICCGGTADLIRMDSIGEVNTNLIPTAKVSSSCCSPSQVLLDGEILSSSFGYSQSEKSLVPDESAELSLGCGNPLALANLQPGETVLDIGSGGGIDAFLAARQVGAAGKVIGVDMTQPMLARARRSAKKAGMDWVEFREGLAEDLPVETGSIDVAISNCVINLNEDKGRVFREIFRVLRPGGRLEVSDVVTDQPFPLDLLASPENWPGCVFGALPEGEYLDLVRQAGFQELHIQRSPSAEDTSGVRVYSLLVSAVKSASD